MADEISRRGFVAAGAGLALMGGGAAAAEAAEPWGGHERIPLWPDHAPGYRGTPIRWKIEDRPGPVSPNRAVSGVAQPMLIVRRPARPNGSAVLVIPGGGYGFLSFDNEGLEQAAWLNALGVTAFILLYRLPAEGWDGRERAPLQDAQRAMRLIRAGARDYGVDPKKAAVLGFSAGGHLAGSLATRHAEQVYAPVDGADSLSARPDAAGLIYPVVSLEAPFSHGGSRDNLLGRDAPAELRRASSVEHRVDANTPPVFLLHSNDDATVPVANSVALHQAMVAAKRPVETHLFDTGGHGFGVRLPKAQPASSWPELFASFCAGRGVFPG